MNNQVRPGGNRDVEAVWRKLDEHTRKFEHLEGQQDQQNESLSEIKVEMAKVQVDLNYMRQGVEAVKKISETLDKYKGVVLALLVFAQLFGPSIAMAIRVALWGQPMSRADVIQQAPQTQVGKP